MPIFLVALAPTLAQTNRWTKPGSGSWEEQTSWSLGVLPNATQVVLFTNAGWKAVAIGTNTSQKFPQSMSMQSLTLSAPVDSYNTLLMNFAGLGQPLHADNFIIGSNSAVVVQSSALDVSSVLNLSPAGTISQGDYSQVSVHSRLSLGDGSYYLTNGTLTVSLLEDFGGSGRFVQYGGSNIINTMEVYLYAEYHLYGGQVLGASILSAGYSGGFFQHGGAVNADVDVGGDFNGQYNLSGGNLTGRMIVPSSHGTGYVQQDGGSNFAAALDIGNGSRLGGFGTYVLSNGLVAVSSATTLNGFGDFEQWNGRHTIASKLAMHGIDLQLYGVAYASYSLHGGIVSAPSLTMSIATFEQEGGSNLINGAIVVGPAGQSSLYTFNGGFLSASNVILSGSVNSGFDQTGGTNIILSELQVAGQGANFHGYTLKGGSLNVNNISISNGAAFLQSGGVINHSGVLTLAGGNWQAGPGQQSLGRMRLASATLTDSSITFPGGASVLRLANSSSEVWSSVATLYVINWNGSASGGGATQLFFGSDSSGLTSQQLTRIKFSLLGKLFPARILATGEVVPQQLLTFSRSGNALMLSWGPGWFLQSSTNVAGPYQDIQAANNPYTATMVGPRRFFRLRQ